MTASIAKRTALLLDSAADLLIDSASEAEPAFRALAAALRGADVDGIVGPEMQKALRLWETDVLLAVRDEAIAHEGLHRQGGVD